MKCQVLIDWLTFSVKSTTDPAEVIQKYLGMDPTVFQDPGYGLLGYQRVLRFSDICVCYDPREDYLCMDDIVRKVQDNEVNSRMTKRAVTVSFNGTQRNGSTVYIGAESSDFRVRIYDKALEQGIEDHWIRVELVRLVARCVVRPFLSM